MEKDRSLEVAVVIIFIILFKVLVLTPIANYNLCRTKYPSASIFTCVFSDPIEIKD